MIVFTGAPDRDVKHYLTGSSPSERRREGVRAGASRGRWFAGRRRSSRCTSWRWRHAGVTSTGALGGGAAARTSLRMRRTGAVTSSVAANTVLSTVVVQLQSNVKSYQICLLW